MDVFEDESSTIEQTSSSAPEVPFTKVKRRKGRNFVEPKVLYEVTDIPMTKGNEKPNSRKFTSSTKSDTTDDFSKADITAYDAVSFVDEKITKALTRREKGTLAAKAIAAQMVPRHLNKKTNTLYKTEMCRNWDESGECRYGRSCQFAHGGKDLRHVDRHGQWKTKTCLAWVNGGCTYGSRCCYARKFPFLKHRPLLTFLDEHLDQVQSPKPDPRIVEEIQELASAKSKSRSKAASHKNTVMYSEKLPAGISRFTKFFEQLATVGKDPIN